MARKDRIIERLEREITVLNKIASDGSEACARIAGQRNELRDAAIGYLDRGSAGCLAKLQEAIAKAGSHE